MSRSYNMSVEVSEFNHELAEAIQASANAEWNFAWFEDVDGNLHGDADGNLCGGESEEEFVDRLSLAIWKANAEFCEVQVIATFLEDLPYEMHTQTREDYHRLLNQQREASS
ncbi:MAG: hypothetical protein AB7I37_12150 [Pirellulales bacterium]